MNETHFGWLMAKTTGLMQDAVLARKAGSWELRGVTKSSLPHMAMTHTVTNGVQATNHRDTLVIATLATRTSALEPLSS